MPHWLDNFLDICFTFFYSFLSIYFYSMWRRNKSSSTTKDKLCTNYELSCLNKQTCHLCWYLVVLQHWNSPLLLSGILLLLYASVAWQSSRACPKKTKEKIKTNIFITLARFFKSCFKTFIPASSQNWKPCNLFTRKDSCCLQNTLSYQY